MWTYGPKEGVEFAVEKNEGIKAYRFYLSTV